MYKAITFFDLDGTLLDGHSQITPEISAAMIQLRNEGVLPVICSGRCEVEIQKIKQAAHINSSITMNGMLGILEGEFLFSNTLDEKLCHETLSFARSLGHELAFYSKEKMFLSGKNQAAYNSYEFFNSAMPVVHETAFQEYPTNMMLILSADQDQLYFEKFGSEFDFYRNGPWCVDVVKKGISKGTAVEEVQQALGQEIPTFAFGDGLNDLPMFKKADYSIAMENAHQDLKDQASYITGKNTDGGIIKALKHYGLL